jgi:hypothetical protein
MKPASTKLRRITPHRQVPARTGCGVRRGSEGASVPAQETILRVGEPHPPGSVRPQVGKAGACGRTRWWDEVEGGSSSGEWVRVESGQD